MHTLSSASRTCIASASAVEWTATVGMPSSLQARSTRSAISPRLAIRILSNMTIRRTRARLSFDDHQRLAELDGLGVLEQDLADHAGARRWDLVESLHRFDDQERVAGLHLASDVDERFRARLRRAIGRADHRR